MKDQQYWKTFWALYVGLVMVFDFFLLPFAMVGVVHSTPPGIPLLPILFSFGVVWAATFGVLLFVAPFGIISIATANMEEPTRNEELEALAKEGKKMIWWGNLLGLLIQFARWYVRFTLSASPELNQMASIIRPEPDEFVPKIDGK